MADANSHRARAPSFDVVPAASPGRQQAVVPERTSADAVILKLGAPWSMYVGLRWQF